MKKYLCIATFNERVNGKPIPGKYIQPGTILYLDDEEAKRLIKARCVIEAIEPAPAQIETAMIQPPENRMKKKGRPRKK